MNPGTFIGIIYGVGFMLSWFLVYRHFEQESAKVSLMRGIEPVEVVAATFFALSWPIVLPFLLLSYVMFTIARLLTLSK